MRERKTRRRIYVVYILLLLFLFSVRGNCESYSKMGEEVRRMCDKRKMFENLI